MKKLMLVCVFLLCSLFTVPAAAQTVAFDDNFDGPAGQLVARVPAPYGVGWTLAVDTCSTNTVPFIVYNLPSGKVAVSSVDSNNYINPIPGGWSQPQHCRRLYLAQTHVALSPDTATDVHWEIDGGSSGRFWGLAKRVQPGGSTFYLAGYYLGYENGGVPLISPNCFLGKVVGGLYTELKSGNCGLKVQGSAIQFSVIGDTLTLRVGGVEKLSVAGGNAITQAGQSGFVVGNWRQASDAWSEGGGYYDFRITDFGGEPLPEPPVTTCVAPNGSVVVAGESGASYTVPLPAPLVVGQSFVCEKVQP